MKMEFLLTQAQAEKIKRLAQENNVSESGIVNLAIEAFEALGSLAKEMEKSTKEANADLDKGLDNLNATLEELKKKRTKEKPESWNDFFQQGPCPDFPTIEELRAGLGEDTPGESLDLSPRETEELFEKSNLLIQIEDYVLTHGVKRASEKLCVTESIARCLAKGLIDKFTVGELQDIANKVPSSFESPFDVGGVKTKATTQDILDAIKDSRSRKGKK